MPLIDDNNPVLDGKKFDSCWAAERRRLQRGLQDVPITYNTTLLQMEDPYLMHYVAKLPKHTIEIDPKLPCDANAQIKENIETVYSSICLNALAIAGGIKVTTRFKTASSRLIPLTYPCPACAFGTPFDDLVIKKWKNREDTPAYIHCERVDNNNKSYWDICCIQNQILTQDMDGIGICGQTAADYTHFREMAKRIANIDIGENPCPGHGGLVFSTTTRARIKIDLAYKAIAIVGDANGNTTTKTITNTISKSIVFGKKLEVLSSLQPIVDMEIANGVGREGLGNAMPNYNGFGRDCPEIEAIAQATGRPCSDGCQPCPTYKGRLVCGYRFWECRRYGSGNDVRCEQTGLSVATNTKFKKKITTLSDAIALTSGGDTGFCAEDVPYKSGGLPCAPPANGIEQLKAYAFEVADSIKKYNWDSAIQELVERAMKLSDDALKPRCGPLGFEVVNVAIAPVGS